MTRVFINRKKKGFGWYSVVNRDKKGDKVADTDVKYLDFVFTKGGEPLPEECSEFGSYEGDLFFHDKKGNEWPIIPFVDEYYHSVCFRILKKANEQPVYHPTTEPKWDLSKEYTPRLDGKPDEEYWELTASNITADDLPPFDE